MYRFEDVRELGLPLSIDAGADGLVETADGEEEGLDFWRSDRRGGTRLADEEQESGVAEPEEGESDGDEESGTSFEPRAARKKYDDEDESEEDVDFDLEDDDDDAEGEEDSDADEEFDDEDEDDLDDDDDDDDDFDDLDDDE